MKLNIVNVDVAKRPRNPTVKAEMKLRVSELGCWINKNAASHLKAKVRDAIVLLTDEETTGRYFIKTDQVGPIRIRKSRDGNLLFNCSTWAHILLGQPENPRKFCPRAQTLALKAVPGCPNILEIVINKP